MADRKYTLTKVNDPDIKQARVTSSTGYVFLVSYGADWRYEELERLVEDANDGANLRRQVGND